MTAAAATDAHVVSEKNHHNGDDNVAKNTKKVTNSREMTRRMICGGLAGMIAKTATNPLERIKMLSQTGEHGVVSTQPGVAGVFQLYRSILHREGFLGLWAGNGINLLRVFPAKAVVFSSNDLYQQMWRKFTAHRAETEGAFVCGGLAGMTATLATYPLDFARGRIAGKLAAAPGQKMYGGILSTLVLTVKDEGFLALYKGATPTLLGAMPYEGIKFGTVGFLEAVFPQDILSPSVQKMIFGGLGGVLAGVITYPNDTVRRLLQLQGSRGTTHNFDGYWDCVRQTIRQHGIKRLYAGLTINLVRMAPNTAVQFGSYELLKQFTEKW